MKKEELIADLRKHLLEEFPLEDISETDIEPDTPLFGDSGLGFDSLDAVELVVLLEKYYGIVIDDPHLARNVFKNLNALSEYILAHRPPSK